MPNTKFVKSISGETMRAIRTDRVISFLTGLILVVAVLCSFCHVAQGAVLPYPKFRAFTATNAPLAGGKLYTYKAGTSTTKAVYTDSTLATPAANPVVLNAEGEASIYLKGSYKLVLKDSAGATIWTLDNVYGIGATGASQISAHDAGGLNAAITMVGATKCEIIMDFDDTLTATATQPSTLSIYWPQGGSLTFGSYDLNANGPNIIDGPYQVFYQTAALGKIKFKAGVYRSIWPENWGCTGDGTTNDTAGWYQWMRSANASGWIDAIVSGTYSLIFTDATYPRASNWWDTLSSMRLRGVHGAKIKIADGAQCAKVTGGTDYDEGSVFKIKLSQHVEITDIEVDGNNANVVLPATQANTTSSCHGFQIDSCDDVKLARVHVHNMGEDGIITQGYFGGIPTSIMLEDFTSDYNGRQGMSIAKVNGLHAKRVKLNNTQNLAKGGPWAGLDIEPNDNTQVWVSNIDFDDFEMVDNYGAHSFYVSNGTSVSVDDKNINFSNGKIASQYTGAFNNYGNKGIHFRHVTFGGEVMMGTGGEVYDLCTFNYNASYGGTSVFATYTTSASAKAIFRDCTWNVADTKKLTSHSAATDPSQIIYYNPTFVIDGAGLADQTGIGWPSGCTIIGGTINHTGAAPATGYLFQLHPAQGIDVQNFRSLSPYIRLGPAWATSVLDGFRAHYQEITVPDEGTNAKATYTVRENPDTLIVTCQDTQGCTMTMDDSNAMEGQQMRIINISAKGLTFADVSNVLTLQTSPTTITQWKTLDLTYTGGIWLENLR